MRSSQALNELDKYLGNREEKAKHVKNHNLKLDMRIELAEEKEPMYQTDRLNEQRNTMQLPSMSLKFTNKILNKKSEADENQIIEQVNNQKSNESSAKKWRRSRKDRVERKKIALFNYDPVSVGKYN